MRNGIYFILLCNFIHLLSFSFFKIFFLCFLEIKCRCKIGSRIRTGATIRIQHLKTGRYLHSHLHRSPLSNQQEVSAYGEGGKGDTGKVIVIFVIYFFFFVLTLFRI
jgi:hypothetical protein